MAATRKPRVRTPRLYLVDVFADRPYSGNPLAVVVHDRALAAPLMQAIAAEIGFSETAFVAAKPARGLHRLRMFTPAAEIAFAGHPLLGAAWVVRRHLAPRAAEVRFRGSRDTLVVDFEERRGKLTAWLEAPDIELGATCAPEDVAPALGLEPDDLDPGGPPQVLAAGTDVLVVQVRAREALARCRLDLAAFAPLAARGFPARVYVACREAGVPGADLAARFFFEAHGVREDPATGSGAAFLGRYLLHHRPGRPGREDLVIAQGHEIGRPSRVLLRLERGESWHVRVGGSVVPVASGTLEPRR